MAAKRTLDNADDSMVPPSKSRRIDDSSATEPNTVSNRRLVRFYPQSNGNGDESKISDSGDDRKPLLAILPKDSHAHESIGSTVNVIDGNVLNPDSWKTTDRKVKIGKLLSPIDPPNIYCIGLNYRKHARESGLGEPKRPVIFMKPTTCVINPNENIIIPACADPNGEVDYEVEMAIVIKKKCRNVSEADALDYVLGYTSANDVSARRWQLNPEYSGGCWVRGKTFDTFCPLGPSLLVQEMGVNGNALKVWTRLNDKLVQNSNTDDLIFNVEQIVSFVSKDTTLLAGTVILTGTPEGVGFARKPPLWMKHGDTVACGVEHIGELINPVVDASVVGDGSQSKL